MLDHKLCIHNPDEALKFAKKSYCFISFCTFFRCKLKFNLVSNTIPRCLRIDDDLTKF